MEEWCFQTTGCGGGRKANGGNRADQLCHLSSGFRTSIDLQGFGKYVNNIFPPKFIIQPCDDNEGMGRRCTELMFKMTSEIASLFLGPELH